MAQPHNAQRITRSARDPLLSSITPSLSSIHAHTDPPKSVGSRSSLQKPKRATSQMKHKKNTVSDYPKHTDKRSKSSKHPCSKSNNSSKRERQSSKQIKSEPRTNPTSMNTLSKLSSLSAKEEDKHEKRVAANSSVNFAHLTDQEQLQRYRNMLKEYNDLKKKVKHKEEEDKYEPPPLMKPFRAREEREFLAAQKKLKQKQFEISDSSDLIQNLTSLLAQKKLRGDSLEFGMIASLVRKVNKNLKKGERNLVGKSERRYFNVASKEGLIEFFTGIRLDQDQELRGSVAGLQTSKEEVKEVKEPNSISRKSELPSLQSSFQVGGQGHANAQRGLNAAMLAQFNLDHPLTPKWG